MNALLSLETDLERGSGEKLRRSRERRHIGGRERERVAMVDRPQIRLINGERSLRWKSCAA